VLRRPDPQVLWRKSLKDEEWAKADATYARTGTGSRWTKSKDIVEPWKIELEGLTFSLSLLPSKHLGVFPEQVSSWVWLEQKIKNELKNRKEVKVLNLFAYTGGATMAALKAGGEVVHLDASKFAVDLAKKNIESSGLKDKKVRLMVDDVRKFVEREIKRGSAYDIILLDPPVYGKGSKGESWKIENDLIPLILRLKNILSKKPIAVVLNGYASSYSGSTYANTLSELSSSLGGGVSFGELGIVESNSKRVLTAGIYARWEA
ncbi:MAG: class I SAM-dependent methyltransferase, partial [Minisyncoccia bacterium]